MGKKNDLKYNLNGIFGWIKPYTNVERLLYLLHRITGLGLVAYLFIHIIEGSMRMYGESAWIATATALDNPAFHIGLYIVILALIFHGLNGIRLILQETGIIVPKPKQPVYPYRKFHTAGQIRPITILMIIIGIIIALVALRDFLIILGVL